MIIFYSIGQYDVSSVFHSTEDSGASPTSGRHSAKEAILAAIQCVIAELRAICPEHWQEAMKLLRAQLSSSSSVDEAEHRIIAAAIAMGEESAI